MTSDFERTVTDEIFSASEAWENMQVLADDIGSRLAGSVGEVAARDFLADALRRYGVDEVEVAPFPYAGWDCAEERLQVISPTQRAIACRCAGLSPAARDLRADIFCLCNRIQCGFSCRCWRARFARCSILCNGRRLGCLSGAARRVDDAAVAAADGVDFSMRSAVLWVGCAGADAQ